ncbi:MAG: type II toxin-antitoxin system HicB family antitoxin [Blautia sp.]|nr:type II toxin-antitoxin system HicB family antitoxin [Blautia sp.]MDY4515807.1 type II toxin-antitoxin system HicB family antitoxin [Lachnospiraceae bacterium]
MLSIYPACFYKEEDGYSVIFPDLNYLATQGDDLEDAMAMAVECLAGYLHSCKAGGEKPQAPSSLQSIDPAAVSKEVSPDVPVGEAFVNMVSVDADAYAKKHFDKSVRKTLTIPAWLNAAALEQGINFSQTLQEALLAKVQSR